MRRNLRWALLLILLLLPEPADAQTRFFERGDSGITPTFDLIATQNSRNKFSWNWGARAVYTYRGLFDVGAGFEEDEDKEKINTGPSFLLANVVLLQPHATRWFGLELKGRYTSYTVDQYWPTPVIAKTRDRSFSGGLRGYYRHASGQFIAGLGGQYTWNKYQTLDQAGDVLWGRDDGELGFTLDGHLLVRRLLHVSLVTEYAQENRYSFLEDWRFRIVLGAGFLFGLNPSTGGANP